MLKTDVLEYRFRWWNYINGKQSTEPIINEYKLKSIATHQF